MLFRSGAKAVPVWLGQGRHLLARDHDATRVWLENARHQMEEGSLARTTFAPQCYLFFVVQPKVLDANDQVLATLGRGKRLLKLGNGKERHRANVENVSLSRER